MVNRDNPDRGTKHRPHVTAAAVLTLATVGAADWGACSERGCGERGVYAASKRTTSILDRYKLHKPDFKDKLPKKLKEVSGVTPISENEVACVQDEDGFVYIYDFDERDITRKMRFGPDGDYEEITSVGRGLFVLRSDGVVFEIRGWENEDKGSGPTVTFYELGISTEDNEALVFDPISGRLLIAPKNRPGGDKADGDARPIFAFDLRTLRLLPDPVLVYSVKALETFAEKRRFEIPLSEGHKGSGRTRALRFLPSSMAIHPVTSEIVLVSSVDRVIASFDRKGTVTGYARLDEKLFRQPEGVAFFPNGDMVVTNEGRGKKATLMRFRLRKRKKRK